MANYPVGSILLVSNVLDSAGRNPKTRNLIVVVDAGADSTQFVGVAVTGTFSHPLGDGHIPLPFSKNPASKCRTGLVKESVAVCDWLCAFGVGDVIKQAGFTPARELGQILDWLEQHHS